jgi:putative intracellular protease/amidase
LALADCNSSNYDIIFFVGGFGVMYDYPLNESVQKLSREIYENGGIVSAVCHGPIAFANVTLSSGEYLVTGKSITGFSEDEEGVVGLKHLLPVHEGAGASCEEVLLARGSNYSKAATFQAHVCADGRLITGQNPASAAPTADAVIAAASQL